MKSMFRTVLFAGATCVGIVGASQVGCSAGQATSGNDGNGSPVAASDLSDGNHGTIGMSLTLPGGDAINSVTFTLKDSGGNLVALPNAANPGTVVTSDSQSIDFQIGGVPAGTGDSITLSATTVDGGSCLGSATGITVTPRVTQNVAVQLTCSLPGADAGNVFVTGTAVYCGTWSSLSSGSNGSEVYVGQTVTLTATANGPDPVNLGYTWSSSASDAGVIGVLGTSQDEAAGPSNVNTFLCAAPGTTTVTVTVDDGTVPPGTTCLSSLTTVSTPVICDPLPAN
jgi:hypothetical protein